MYSALNSLDTKCYCQNPGILEAAPNNGILCGEDPANMAIEEHCSVDQTCTGIATEGTTWDNAVYESITDLSHLCSYGKLYEKNTA